jgi:hypothetical protein
MHMKEPLSKGFVWSWLAVGPRSINSSEYYFLGADMTLILFQGSESSLRPGVQSLLQTRGSVRNGNELGVSAV